MIAIPEVKLKTLRADYAAAGGKAVRGGRVTFAEYVERRSRKEAGFFRWLTGRAGIADYGRNLSEATRTIILSAAGY